MNTRIIKNKQQRHARHQCVLWCVASLLLFTVIGCSPVQQANTESGGQTDTSGGTEMSMSAWSTDSDCGTCHNTEMTSYENTACLMSLHQDSSCTDCHNQALESVHQGDLDSDGTPKRLKATEVSDETCLGCHYGSIEELIKASDQAGIVLTDNDGNTRNPHDVGNVAEHQEQKCTDCHKMHGEDSVDLSAQRYCKSCHHEGVFECYTCHG